MKKSILPLLFCSISLLAYPNEYNDDTTDTTNTTDTTVYVENQSVVNNIVGSTQKTNFITSGKSFAAGAELIHAGDITVLNIPVGIQVGSGFGLEINTPFVRVEDHPVPNTFSGEKENNMGIGDISGGVNYHFGSLLDEIGLNTTTLLVKSTTGNEIKGLGSKEHAVSFTQEFKKVIASKYTLGALGSYTFNDERASGDAYLLMIGGSMPCLFTDKINTSLKLTYFEVKDHTVNNFTSGKLENADIWIQWDSLKLINDVPLGFGVKIPLKNEINDGFETVKKDKTVLFYLSITSLF